MMLIIRFDTLSKQLLSRTLLTLTKIVIIMMLLLLLVTVVIGWFPFAPIQSIKVLRQIANWSQYIICKTN